MSFPETVKLLQFRAAYQLPVHAGIETGIFAQHALTLETAYTPGSLYINKLSKRADVISAIPARMTSSPMLKEMTVPIFSCLWVCIVGYSRWSAFRIANRSTRSPADLSALMPRPAASRSCWKECSTLKVLSEEITSLSKLVDGKAATAH